MNSAKRLLGVIFVGLASTALFIACGESADSCLTDTDCQTGFVCEDELCIQECVTAADCPAFDECVPRPSGSAGSICVEGDEPPATNNNTTTNNTTGLNNPQPYSAVMIRDITTGEGCNELDPGSDIASAALQTLEGATLGYFEALYDSLGSEQNDFTAVYSVLDGSAPGVGLACPEDFNSDTVVALGCGGYVVGRFVDSSTTPLFIDSSNQIGVQEYGPGCGTGSAADTFEIVLCTDAQAAFEGNISSCTNVLNSGSGLVIADDIE